MCVPSLNEIHEGFLVIGHTSQNVLHCRHGGETSISETFVRGYNEIYTDRALVYLCSHIL